MFGGDDSNYSMFSYSGNWLRGQKDIPCGLTNSDCFGRPIPHKNSFFKDLSRDSGCVFSNHSFSSNQSVDTSLPNQTFESGYACESFDAFNRFPSINNVSYDGCYFEDDSPKATVGLNRSLDHTNPGILATALSQGGDLGRLLEKFEHETINAVAMTKYGAKLRKCWETITKISDLVSELTNKPLELEEPKEWNLTNLCSTFYQQYNLIRERLVGPKMTSLLFPIGQILDQIRDTPQIDHARMFEHLQDCIQMLHWMVAAEIASKNSLRGLSRDQFRIDKAYELWNKCS